MVVYQPMSSLAPKQLKSQLGQRTKRLSVSPVTSPDIEQSSEYYCMEPFLKFYFTANLFHQQSHTLTLSPGYVQIGPVMGTIFIAFMMGVGLMGGLWCIYNYTGNEISFLPLLNSYGTTIQYTISHTGGKLNRKCGHRPSKQNRKH